MKKALVNLVNRIVLSKTDKRYILALLLVSSISITKAQITLEHTFNENFYYINLTQAGNKYVVQDSSKAKIYNMDYSLYKTINLPNYLYGIANISDNLFNSDPLIEIAFYTDSSGNYQTLTFSVISENGTIIFQHDSIRGGGLNSFSNGNNTFFNTNTGWKMTLETYSGSVDVFSLPGTQPQITGLINSSKASPFNLSYPYPNPSSDMATINFTFPTSINEGEIVIYDEQGELIKTLRVDNTFGKVLLNNSGLSAGTYYYLIKAGSDISDTKKMVVIP